MVLNISLTGNDLHPSAQEVDGGAAAEEEEQHRDDGQQGDDHGHGHEYRARPEWDVGDRRQIVQAAHALFHQLTCNRKKYRCIKFDVV